MSNSPINAAKHLADALEENTAALTALKRRYRIVLGTLILTVLLVVAMVVTRYDQRLTACERDNALREANTALWEPLLEREPVPPGPDATQEEFDEYNQQLEDIKVFKAALVEGFSTRDCDNIGWL